jgi:hypothetical protein
MKPANPQPYLKIGDAARLVGVSPSLIRSWERLGVRMELPAWGNTVMEPHLFRISPHAGSGESYTHEGEEFSHVLQGQLHISIAKWSIG